MRLEGEEQKREGCGGVGWLSSPTESLCPCLSPLPSSSLRLSKCSSPSLGDGTSASAEVRELGRPGRPSLVQFG